MRLKDTTLAVRFRNVTLQKRTIETMDYCIDTEIRDLVTQETIALSTVRRSPHASSLIRQDYLSTKEIILSLRRSIFVYASPHFFAQAACLDILYEQRTRPIFLAESLMK